MSNQSVPMCDCHGATGKKNSRVAMPTTTDSEGYCNHCGHYAVLKRKGEHMRARNDLERFDPEDKETGAWGWYNPYA